MADGRGVNKLDILYNTHGLMKIGTSLLETRPGFLRLRFVIHKNGRLFGVDTDFNPDDPLDEQLQEAAEKLTALATLVHNG